MPEDRKNMWNWTLTIGSTLVPFMFGLLFTSMVQGMPIDAEGNMSAHFGDYVNLFSVVGGIALTLLCYLHGLNYIALKLLVRSVTVPEIMRVPFMVCYILVWWRLPRYFISKQISLKNILLRRFFC